MATAKTETKTLSITAKLSAIQTQIKAPKNLYNSFGKYNYRNAESILESVKPYLKELGVILTLNDSIELIGDRYYVKATAQLMDCESGDYVYTTAYARETEEKKGMDGSQVTGATSSYARKYALNGLFLLDDTKDADTDEYHKQTAKPESKDKPDEATLTAELKNLWTTAGGKEGFEDWFKNMTKDGFTEKAYGTMKAMLLKKINEKESK